MINLDSLTAELYSHRRATGEIRKGEPPKCLSLVISGKWRAMDSANPRFQRGEHIANAIDVIVETTQALRHLGVDNIEYLLRKRYKELTNDD